jgi:peptidoglycan hydrolase-like protein with peptidoglycan-binding domain/lysophospholipase L1-like esterase
MKICKKSIIYIVFLFVLVVPLFSAQAFTFKDNLLIGSEGVDVVELQKTLKGLGFFSYPTNTGYFGSVTKKAVELFQSSRNVSPTGVVDAETVKLLNTLENINKPVITESEGLLNFSRNIFLGSYGEDVKRLQKFLNSQGFYVSESGPGSIGNETMLFGRGTQSALVRFQNFHQIKPAIGFLGPVTRTKILSLENKLPTPEVPKVVKRVVSGNSNSSNRADTENSAPVVSFTSPANGAIVSGSSVEISASVSDASAITGVQFSVDSVNVGLEDTSSPYSITWDSTSVADGSHTIGASATDVYNNIGTSSITVTVDNTGPIISNILVTPDSDTEVTVTWTTNEASDSLIDYGTTSSYGLTETSASLVTSHSLQITGLTVATDYHFKISSTDANGNLSESTDQTFSTFTGEFDDLDNRYAIHGTKRLLSSHTGPLVRIRRSSDDAESNFSPNAEGYLDADEISTWLEGTAGYVTTVYDQTGNSRNLTQTTAANQPTIYLSGLYPSIYYSRADSQYHNMPSGLSFARNISAVSLVSVRRQANISSSTLPLIVVANNANSTRISLNTTGGVNRAGGRRLDADSFVSTTGFSENVDWGVEVGRFDFANTDLFHRVNAGEQTNLSFSSGGVTSNTDSTSIRVGADPQATPTLFFDGEVMMTAFVRDKITDVEEDTLVTSLSDLFIDESTIDLYVQVHGDSMTFRGFYPYLLKKEIENNQDLNTLVRTRGFGGVSWNRAQLTRPKLIDDGLIAVDTTLGDGDVNWLIGFAGTNGIALDLNSAATEYANFETWIDDRINAGWDPSNIIIGTMLPRDGVSNTTRDSYNNLLIAGATTYGYTIAPFHLNASIGANGQDADTDYFLDGIHPTIAGYQIMSDIIYDIMFP